MQLPEQAVGPVGLGLGRGEGLRRGEVGEGLGRGEVGEGLGRGDLGDGLGRGEVCAWQPSSTASNSVASRVMTAKRVERAMLPCCWPMRLRMHGRGQKNGRS